MQKRFQYILSFTLLAILFIGFIVYSIWVENIIYNNLKNQALKDNLTIGETVLGMLDKSDIDKNDRIAFIQLVQETADVLKMPNKGFICMMDSTGALLAAPGLTPSKEVRISDASFYSVGKDEKYSFKDFFSAKPFTGYYEYEEIGYSDVVVALNHTYSGYKLMVHQDANVIRAESKEKSLPILWVGLSFAALISIFSYFIISRQVKSYQFKIEIQNDQLSAVNEEVQDKNKVLGVQNAKLEELAEEKSALLGILAHDLKNPIGGISSVIRLINHVADLNDEQETYFSLIKSQVKSAETLISDVLEMNMVESDQKSVLKDKIDLVKLLNQKMESFTPLAEKKQISIRLTQSTDELWLKTGVNELNRIVDNLLSNSIKYSPLKQNVSIELKQMPNCVEIYFIDEGSGIKQEELPLLFKKFSKLSTRPTNEEESSGLGLYIVKLLADKIGAKVKVNSTFGEGSKFILELPIG